MSRAILLGVLQLMLALFKGIVPQVALEDFQYGVIEVGEPCLSAEATRFLVKNYADYINPYVSTVYVANKYIVNMIATVAYGQEARFASWTHVTTKVRRLCRYSFRFIQRDDNFVARKWQYPNRCTVDFCRTPPVVDYRYARLDFFSGFEDKQLGQLGSDPRSMLLPHQGKGLVGLANLGAKPFYLEDPNHGQDRGKRHDGPFCARGPWSLIPWAALLAGLIGGIRLITDPRRDCYFLPRLVIGLLLFFGSVALAFVVVLSTNLC